MHSKSSWEAVNRAGPFVSEFELAQQTGIAYPAIWVAESMGASRVHFSMCMLHGDADLSIAFLSAQKLLQHLWSAKLSSISSAARQKACVELVERSAAHSSFHAIAQGTTGQRSLSFQDLV
ncbi:hypothetical protein Q9233_015218 [Columba guinea]|nr:hypothetical protein Q9233_015218 [Columba guinea]